MKIEKKIGKWKVGIEIYNYFKIGIADFRIGIYTEWYRKEGIFELDIQILHFRIYAYKYIKEV